MSGFCTTRVCRNGSPRFSFLQSFLWELGLRFIRVEALGLRYIVCCFFIEGAGLAFRVNNLLIMDKYFDEDTYLR